MKILTLIAVLLMFMVPASSVYAQTDGPMLMQFEAIGVLNRLGEDSVTIDGKMFHLSVRTVIHPQDGDSAALEVGDRVGYRVDPTSSARSPVIVELWALGPAS